VNSKTTSEVLPKGLTEHGEISREPNGSGRFDAWAVLPGGARGYLGDFGNPFAAVQAIRADAVRRGVVPPQQVIDDLRPTDRPGGLSTRRRSVLKEEIRATWKPVGAVERNRIIATALIYEYVELVCGENPAHRWMVWMNDTELAPHCAFCAMKKRAEAVPPIPATLADGTVVPLHLVNETMTALRYLNEADVLLLHAAAQTAQGSTDPLIPNHAARLKKLGLLDAHGVMQEPVRAVVRNAVVRGIGLEGPYVVRDPR